VSRLPIRVRLTAAIALAMVLVLTASGVFVYLRLEADLTEGVDAGLEARAAAVAATGQADAGATEDPEEGFAQVLGPGGRVAGSTADLAEPVLTKAELAQVAAGEELMVEREVEGVEATARVLAIQASARQVVVVGQSLEDRDETLAGLVASFAVGGPIAVLLASLLGYAVATAGLRPVEAMRRRASEVSLSPDGGSLPLPAAHDEVRRLGETLNEMLDRLRASFERERRFVADASHELRTPVAVVKAEVETALRAGGHDPEVREGLVAAVEECDRLAQLAEDLLVLARSAEGALPVRAEQLDARELLEGVRQRFAARAAEHGRALVVEADAGVTVAADPIRLRQALGNLVDNALRHGGGAVVLGARAAAGSVELEVRDEGPGFDHELAPRAFERFARGDGARAHGGAGLGLAIVRAIAEAHGATAEIDGMGPGARVVIRLPAQVPEAYHSV